MKKYVFLFSLVLPLALVADAQAVLLSDLIGGGSITVGDVEFSGWDFFDDSLEAVAADEIDVTGDSSDLLNPGLIFEIAPSSAFTSAMSVVDQIVYINFTATTVSGDPLIIGSSLELTGFDLTGSETAFIEILSELDGGASEDFVVFDTEPDPDVVDLFASHSFAAVSTVDFEVSPLLMNDDPGVLPTTVSLTEFRMNFALAPSTAVVPEPATMAIWSVFGAVGFGYARRRRIKMKRPS